MDYEYDSEAEWEPEDAEDGDECLSDDDKSVCDGDENDPIEYVEFSRVTCCVPCR